MFALICLLLVEHYPHLIVQHSHHLLVQHSHHVFHLPLLPGRPSKLCQDSLYKPPKAELTKLFLSPELLKLSGFALRQRRRGEAMSCLPVVLVPYLLVPYLLAYLITSHGGRTKQAVPLPLDSYITICMQLTPHHTINISTHNKPSLNIFFWPLDR